MLMIRNSTRSLVALTAIAACSFMATAQDSRKSTQRAKDEAAIRENVRKMEEGWNTKNGTLFAEPFAEDADGVPIGGRAFKGHDVIEKAHWELFKTVFKDSTITLQVRQLRFLRPDVALVQIHNHNKWQQGEAKGEHNSTITLVMTREVGGWEIASFQNTLIGAPSFQQK
ncbi:MAG TPA: SgcJ/EcaC family oxidoreductase [Blastocatellia bacterium]|nr:SgcJ/EcaC family oxidoreductase [Blastocatellia bacterium]